MVKMMSSLAMRFLESTRLLIQSAVLHYGGYVLLISSLGCYTPCVKNSNVNAAVHEQIDELVLRQFKSQPSPTGLYLPWTMRIRPPGDWSFLMDTPGRDLQWSDESKTIETARIISICNKYGVLNIPEGDFGMHVADYPYVVIAVKAAGRTRTYRVGSPLVVRDDQPDQLGSALTLLEMWCEVVDELSLPPEAYSPPQQLKSTMLFLRQNIGKAADHPPHK